MVFKIDVSKIITGVLTVAILAFVGGIWDFQNIKAQVTKNSQGIKDTNCLLGVLYYEIQSLKQKDKAEKLPKDFPKDLENYRRILINCKSK